MKFNRLFDDCLMIFYFSKNRFNVFLFRPFSHVVQKDFFVSSIRTLTTEESALPAKNLHPSGRDPARRWTFCPERSTGTRTQAQAACARRRCRCLQRYFLTASRRLGGSCAAHPLPYRTAMNARPGRPAMFPSRQGRKANMTAQSNPIGRRCTLCKECARRPFLIASIGQAFRGIIAFLTT